MRFGTSFVIDVDRIVPDFKTVWHHDEIFPTAEICDFDSWRLRKNYMKVVRPEEDHDVTGNPKGYVMQPEFQIVFLATYTTDENIVRLYRSIPDASMMSLLIVKPQETEEEIAARMKLIREQELREANNPT